MLKVCYIAEIIFYLHSAVILPKQNFGRGYRGIDTKKIFVRWRGVISATVMSENGSFLISFVGKALILEYNNCIRKEGKNVGPAFAAVAVALQVLQ